jgi:vacuolar iron transporter family protein
MALEDVYRRNLHHRTHRAGWLRAAVLGANDGLVSTASLMIGVAAAKAGEQSFLVTAGAAGIAAGAMSMAVGEYVSVRSQNDIEESDRLLEIEHLAIDPEGEFEELVEIYMKRGLSRELAVQVVDAMHKRDPLEAHLRDELGQSTYKGATSAGGNCIGMRIYSRWTYSICWSLRANPGCGCHQHCGLHDFGLVATGMISAKTAGSKLLTPTLRVIGGGILGMAITAGIGRALHVSGI